MENRGHRTGEELASAKKEFRSFRSSSRNNRVAEPSAHAILISLKKDSFLPSDFLTCEYQVELHGEQTVQAIEASVLWITEGKGEEDIGVHFFERRKKQSITSETFKTAQRISTVLPASPLSYEGKILKVLWCVRVRIFLDDGDQITEDKYFKLGEVKAFAAPTPRVP